MATGKSTIGRTLARQIDIPMLDMDKELEKQIGMTIPDFFSIYSEEQFRAEELSLLKTLSEEMNLSIDQPRLYPRRYVLSTGGGVPVSEQNRPFLRDLGYVVWLKATIKTIVDRCRPKIEKRPMLAGHEHDLEEHISALLTKRIPAYEATAHMSIWTDDLTSADEIATRIRRRLPRN